ncbi:MAG: lysophospholipase L1-like esterase [Planctomycetaceae bacterium]|jgi:lysophospholipase L1-like esterase
MSIARAEPTRLVLLLFALSCNTLSAAEPTKLVVFGDSTTAKRGELKIYAEILEQELPRRGMPVHVVNAGVGGNNTEHARARFDKDVLGHAPGVVIIQFGINDAAVDVWKDPPATKSRVSIEKFAENIRYFVRTLKAHRTRVVLMTPNPLRWTPKMRELYGKPPYLLNDANGFNVKLEAYAATARQIAKAENVPLLDVYRSFELFEKAEGQSVDDLLLDGIHPNERGHRLVAEQLLSLLLKSGQPGSSDSSATIEVKIVDNPVDSTLNRTTAGTTNVRFEDYVSNPPPNHRDPVQGWVGQFSIPFTGLVKPLAANTTVSPLPEPVGLLIESSADTVGFYDPSSRVDCADARADKLIFRFVNPANSRRAATVSRVAFRLTGTSVLNGKVRYSLHDISGRTLASGVAKPNPTTRRAESEVDCTARLDGKVNSVIHKVVVEHSGPGYFVVGGVMHPKEADLNFDGFYVSDQNVRRQLGEQIPLAHPEQWQNSGKAELITDMTLCTPTDALSKRREHAKWKVFQYETAEFSGKCLSIGRESSAPDLTLKLGKQGWHAVYIGLSTITDLVRPEKNNVEVRLTSDPAYTRLSNRLDLASPRRDVLDEVFLGVADLNDNDLHFSTVYEMPARIHYVKIIPLTDAEAAAELADRKQKATRTSVATFDGFTWIHPFRPQNRADLAATFSAYRQSDFKTWWFQVGGADLVHHPTKVGNLMGGHLDTFPRSVDREYVESVRHLHSKGVDPLRVAVEEAHAQDAEILICLRAAGWKGAPPWEEFFMSEFYEAHPEWRCIDHDGTPTMHMSYAVEEVQDHLLKVYREVLQRGPDGAGFMFHRGMPMMLWEEPFCRRFIKKVGEDPRELAEDDPRVFQMRAEIVTGFMRKIRAVLDETAKKQGDSDRRLKLAVTTFATLADNKRFGLDVETWIEEKLIDQVGIAWFAHYTSGIKTKSGETAYYSRITEGTDVKIFPFYVGWKMDSAADLLSKVARDYDAGADGIAVWDPNQFEEWQSGNNPYWPLVSRLGHRDQIRDGSLLYKPVATPLTRLGENRYSRWYPNTGF